VYHFCRAFSEKAQGSIARLEEELLNRPVVMTDATVVTVNGKRGYIRNFSMEKGVRCHAMKDKTLKAMGKLHFLSKFTGILVHDHETALYHFGTGHGECNAHIMRYLKKNGEDSANSWSGDMISLLCEMNRERKHAISRGKRHSRKAG
jgi:transposase